MSIKKIKKTVYQCTCERPECQHVWEAAEIPERCAKCKYTSWNGVDKRTREYKESQKRKAKKAAV